ncbi:MAG: hypothetical protein GY851_03475 [bacterium]|nr:hypothetical protein [bacterium]
MGTLKRPKPLDPAKASVVLPLLEKFPGAGTMTLAKKAYSGKNQALWKDLEGCRHYIRRLRGNRGASDRASIINGGQHTKHIRPAGKAGNPWGAVPKGITSFKDWRPVQFDGPLRVLSLFDVHVPYHNDRALHAALNYGVENKANVIHLAGDAMDMFSLSKWEKDPRERKFNRELGAMKALLAAIRKGFPRAKIVYQIGNHEERYESYMYCKAPELLDVSDFLLEKLLDFKKYNVIKVGDKRPVKFGDLPVLHGHEWKSGFSAPVNPARTLFLKAKCNAACGHLHQTSQHSETDLEGKVVSTWSAGCLCDTHPDYAPINKWNHGCMLIKVDRDGAFEVRNQRIIKGRVYE